LSRVYAAKIDKPRLRLAMPIKAGTVDFRVCIDQARDSNSMNAGAFGFAHHVEDEALPCNRS